MMDMDYFLCDGNGSRQRDEYFFGESASAMRSNSSLLLIFDVLVDGMCWNNLGEKYWRGTSQFEIKS